MRTICENQDRQIYRRPSDLNNLLLAVIVAFVLIAFILAYQKALFNFFIADDFIYMVWARDAVNHPGLLLEKYCKPYPNEPVLVYRPFLFTVLFIGYKLWGANGLSFRLVSICVELLTGVMLGLVLFLLYPRSASQDPILTKNLKAWAVLSGALFVLCPLHSEPVIWMSIITNPLVTLFMLIALWCYIRWRRESKPFYFILSIISSILSFLTKEQAVTLPLTLLAYEAFFSDNVVEANRKEGRKLYKGIVQTFPYWIILLAYFGIRKLILHNFIAGYPDNLCYPTISGWLHSICCIFVPINTTIIGSHSLIFKAWHVFLFATILLFLFAFVKADKNSKSIIYFLIIWFLLSLAPNYKVFPTLMSCATGSRLVYSATAPLCALFVYGLVMFGRGRLSFLLTWFFALVSLGLSATILNYNNLAWVQAGHWTNKVFQELKNYYRTTNGDPLVYITGLPMSSNKGIYTLGILQWTTKIPNLERDIDHCRRLESEQYIKTSFIKQAAIDDPSHINLLYWDSFSESLKPVTPVTKEYFYRRNWFGEDLKKILDFSISTPNFKPTVCWLDNGGLLFKSNTNGFIELHLKLPNLPCWSVDFLGLKVTYQDPRKVFPLTADLRFKNYINQNYEKGSVSYDVPIKPTDKEQKIIFPLRNSFAWSMGGECSDIKIILPVNGTVSINEISVPEVNGLLPDVRLPTSTIREPGMITLNNLLSIAQSVKYDARAIKGAREITLEVSKYVPSAYGVANQIDETRKSFFRKHNLELKGHFELKRDEFPLEPAIYKANIVVLNDRKQQVGISSDDFFIRTGQ